MYIIKSIRQIVIRKGYYPKYHRFRIRLHYGFFLLAILIFAKNGTVLAKDDSGFVPSQVKLKSKRSNSYCGLYCLYTVMRLADKNVNFADLLKKEYIGSREGSSLLELKKAAEDYGLYALPVENLTSNELRKLSCPVILHVKSNPNSRDYNHFELFLGERNSHARLFDPPEPIKSVPFWRLAPRWDGTGLIISSTPIDPHTIFTSSRRRLIIYAVMVIPFMLLARWSKQRLCQTTTMSRYQLLELSMAQGVGFVLLAILIGFVYHFVNNEGFLAHSNATASIQQAYAGTFIPKINGKKVDRLLHANAVFIDARYARDFTKGHLEGAVNIPVDANERERCEALRGIDKKACIVVYCQSSACLFAEKVALKLKSDGFTNVSLFKDGWVKWKKKN